MDYYIYSRDISAWWRGPGAGTTKDLNAAHKYSYEEAARHALSCLPAGRVVAVPSSYLTYGIYGVSDVINHQEPSRETEGGDTEGYLIELYNAWLSAEQIGFSGSADELIHDDWLTDAQRIWLTEFIKRWEAVVDKR